LQTSQYCKEDHAAIINEDEAMSSIANRFGTHTDVLLLLWTYHICCYCQSSSSNFI